jgi:hypothetical protein
MKYKCEDEILKGIEQAAFHLHCSARQLQRILNQSETNGLVKKLGKGDIQADIKQNDSVSQEISLTFS